MLDGKTGPGSNIKMLLTLASAYALTKALAPAGSTSAPARAPAGTPPKVPAEVPAQAAAADGPQQIPPATWLTILKRAYTSIMRDRVITIAAGVTFYSLLAIFPGVAAIVSLYGLFADAGTIQQQISGLAGLLPGGAVDIIGDEVKRVAGQGHAALGTGFFIGLATSLWSANAGMKSMFDALNVVYEEEERRGFIRLTIASLVFTLGAIAFLLIAMAALVVVPLVLQFVGLGEVAAWILWIARWPALLIVIVSALAMLYRFGPSRARAKWRWITPGSLFAAFAWLAASALFSYYVANFGSYNKTYGSLGATIGFMTWIWISAVIVLFGGEINAQMERATESDTTTGPPQPRGQRGAAVADQPAR
jgi:membrane protein